MPWVPLLAGCCAGIVATGVLALFARGLAQPSVLGTWTRAAFVPVVAGVAFLLHDPYRQLAGALPVRAWLTTALRVALALPLLAGTCGAELWLADAASRLEGGLAAGFAAELAVEFAAAATIALAAAAAVARGRWHDLGGALAAPGALAALALLVLLAPHLQRQHLLPSRLLTPQLPPSLLAAAAAALVCWASRDPWRRLRCPGTS
jgi:hypothetical protein